MYNEKNTHLIHRTNDLYRVDGIRRMERMEIEPKYIWKWMENAGCKYV